MKGQSILGEEDFMDEFIGHIKGFEDIGEIPKSQCLMDRPSLRTPFSQEITQDRKRRNLVIGEAVYRYGYKQNEVAQYIGLHYSTVSRLLIDKQITSKVKTLPSSFFNNNNKDIKMLLRRGRKV
jgi:hypothetical protein